jgi:large conductance mechanosensitive channel
VLKGFREFISRGNVVDLAVAVVIGAAFTALVNAFVANLINPILGVFGTQSLTSYIWCIKHDPGVACAFDPKTGGVVGGVGVGWGAMVSAIITFVLTALVVYFVFVLPMNKYRDKFQTPTEEAEAEELSLLREIRDELRAQRPSS